MKTFFTTIFILQGLVCASLFAAMTSVLLEESDGGATIDATIYGVVGNGVPKKITFTNNDVKLADNLENCELFNLNRHVLRFWMFFDQSGNLNKIDFHMAENFESKVFNIALKPQNKILSAPAMILSDPDDDASPMVANPASHSIDDPADAIRFAGDKVKIEQITIQAGKLKTLLESK